MYFQRRERQSEQKAFWRELPPKWMSHVSEMHQPPHIPKQALFMWRSRVTYAWVTSHMKEGVTCEWDMSHINEACRIWMRHAISRMNEACRTWMSHGTHNWGMSHMNEPCDRSSMNVSWRIWMCHVTYEWVICMSHVTWEWVMSHMTYGWVMSHINESCHIPKQTFSDVLLWAIAHMNESCHIWMSLATCELVMSHITYGWVMSYMDDVCHI